MLNKQKLSIIVMQSMVNIIQQYKIFCVAQIIDEELCICYYYIASRTCGEFDFRKKIAHNDCGSGEQSSS